MDKKTNILMRMDQELNRIAEGNYDLSAGESYQTAQLVHSMLRKLFSETFVPDHILDLVAEQENPLEKMYDYYLDSGYLIKGIDENVFCKEYLLYVEYNAINSKVKQKIEVEYKQFLELLKDRPPIDIQKLVSEVTLKMQIYSMFRYDDCCNTEDLEILFGVENLLDKAFRGYNGESLVPTDTNYLWAVTMEQLDKIISDERHIQEVEDEELEA